MRGPGGALAGAVLPCSQAQQAAPAPAARAAGAFDLFPLLEEALLSAAGVTRAGSDKLW